MKNNIKIVVVGMNIYMGEVIRSNNSLYIKDAIQIHMNPINNQVSIIPPLFGKCGSVEIHEPTNITIYTPDDKVLEQYEKAVSTFKSGIIPANQIPTNININPKKK